jgi:hypothetical protein
MKGVIEEKTARAGAQQSELIPADKFATVD